MKLSPFKGSVLAFTTLALAGVSGPARADDEHGHGHDKKWQHEQRKEDKREVREDRREDRAEARLDAARQRELIQLQEARTRAYTARLAQQQRLAEQRAAALRQANRQAHYRFQEDYLARLREQQNRVASLRSYNYNSDPYFYTAPSYRYTRSGRTYQVNRYAADLLRQAVNNGYEEGVRAGQADRQDGYRSGYQSSYAYQDANYGYTGLYVDQADYNYYFRQGFQRGYQDGYNSRFQYGTNNGGTFGILANVLSTILNLQPLS